jgi:release factor glutamine methyltransferase
VSALSAWRARAIAQLIGAGVSEAEATEGCVWLLEDLAGLNRATQVTRPDLALSEQVVTLLNEALERRLRREPLSHILGSWSFWGLDFKVTRAVLTPRPDTEVLVEEALTWLKGTSSEVELIVDVCSGTGCVGLALASERAERVLLIELCEEACVVLKDNARALNDQGLLRATVELRQGSLLAPLLTSERPLLIVSNPPYIERAELAELMPEVRDFEPHLALDGGEDGLDLVRELVIDGYKALKPGGALMMEVGWRQTECVSALYQEAGFQGVRVRRDYGGNPRVVIGEKPSSA